MSSDYFLSRVFINPARRASRGFLASPSKVHGAVERGFPENTHGARRLWRIDQNDHSTMLYVVSEREPDFTHIVEQVGRPAVETWQTKPYGPFLNKLEEGQIWRMRLTANPVRNGRGGRLQKRIDASTKGMARGTKRVGHLTANQQLLWLLKRADKWGFGVVDITSDPGSPEVLQPPFVTAESEDNSIETLQRSSVTVVGRSVVPFRRGANGGKANVTLSRASFEGLVQVTDPPALRAALVAGMGHGKAYGCGLMTLIRP